MENGKPAETLCVVTHSHLSNDDISFLNALRLFDFES
jgi:hypothetical protein